MCKQLTTAAAPTPGKCRDEGEKNGVPGELEGNGHCIPGSLWLWKIPGKLGQAERDLCAGLKAGIAPGRSAREEADSSVHSTRKVQAQLDPGTQAMTSGFSLLFHSLSSSPIPTPATEVLLVSASFCSACRLSAVAGEMFSEAPGSFLT